MTTAAAYLNEATLKYRLSFTVGPDLEGTLKRTSGTGVVGSTYYHGLCDPKGVNAGNFMHNKDPERQTINLLANMVLERLGCPDDQYLNQILAQVTGGEIQLITDKGPCHSCRNIIKQFLGDFPMIGSFVVVYRKTSGRGEPILALEPAGKGLYGAYGYEDAVEVNGSWSKTLR
ncbi:MULTISPECIES: hypothetical protein [unclassified Streptomyces]|uniref:hypothetical protein n=1 Tax=unclassified Streptomyces TaxID=2593676 RepID=UPI001E2FDAC8|nr:hypothetical protein [Streptomyces sp. MBT42]MCD2469428.1 hypothetical protein [Streptomyces sp. MBT42]